MKLFAIYVGGEMPGANIELHDIRFIVAPTIGETYEELRRQWWGTPDSLHIDCWTQLDHVDGYDIVLRPEPYEGVENLFFVNLGGYDNVEFAETHKNMFVVAASVPEAKARAIETVRDWHAPHRDDFYEAEQAFGLQDTAAQARLNLHLIRSPVARALTFTCDYTPLEPVATQVGTPSTQQTP